jgi:hypothetical protein
MAIDIAATEPCTIWLPEYDGDAPPCYHGTPLDVVTAMARDFSLEPRAPASAIRLLLQDLEVATGLSVELPPTMPLHLRGAAVLGLLLETGLAREAPKV